MISKQQLVDGFALNLRLLQMQTEGLTHSDSLLQPQLRGNCMNWVLGHMAVSRDRILELLDLDLQLTEELRARYETDSAAMTEDEEGILKLENLLAVLANGQSLLADKIFSMSDEDLAEKIQIGERRMTVGQRLFGLYFHDTYHTGQIEYLRQLAGTNDKIV